MSYKVRNVLITGANRGIGLEFVKQILEKFKPDNLFATYRDAEKSKELLSLTETNVNLHAIQLDVSDYDKFAEIVKEVDTSTNGAGLNLIINNSGILEQPSKKGIRDIDRKTLLSHVEVNTIAPVLLTQAFLPLLEKAASSNSQVPIGIQRAAIVNISTKVASISDNTSGGLIAYRVTKTALNMASKCISLDLKDCNILTLLLHPGWVQTDMGGPNALITTEHSVSFMLKTLQNCSQTDNGKFFNFDGQEIPW